MNLSPKNWSTLSPRAVLASLIMTASVPAAVAHAASDTDPSDAFAASAKLETDNFVAQMSATGPYKAGAPATVKVALTTKGIFHINGQYPYRFKTAPAPDGISYSKAVLERADGRFEEKTAVFTLPFVASHAGTFNVGGVFHMSVCSPTSCVVQKAPLDISVTVR